MRLSRPSDFMISGTFGRYAAISARDHGEACSHPWLREAGVVAEGQVWLQRENWPPAWGLRRRLS
jgi:hypothetical protein